jgi:hypothetical protein
MIGRVRRPARRSRRLSRMQWGGALTAAAAALALFSLPAGAARADGSGYDPVSGGGSTASAVTVSWTNGLLDTSNNPITTNTNGELSPNSDRSKANPTSPLSFMYDDFKDLKVTVSQTQDITHQGITVSWAGKPSVIDGDHPAADFLQMMECYGDAASGPTPEQCEYGSAGMIGNQVNQTIGQRDGSLCAANAVPSITNPPADQGGSTSTGCDTQEATDSAAIPPKCPAAACSGGSFVVPFQPVDPTKSPDYGFGDTTYFSNANTNEVQEAVTGTTSTSTCTATDTVGCGQQQFETLTGVQASGLGCGLQDADNNNQPRGCWLVIVPRGQYEPNGKLYSAFGPLPDIDTSPLSASNWAQRIQIHLGFAPVQAFCPIGTAEIPTVGTQLAARAMQSWQLALNHAANCTKVYGYTAAPESTSTQQLLSATTGGAGLAFTTIPIGSEATRTGGSPPSNLPPILYAPVAVSALGFGFNINRNGYYSTPVKLDPTLLAKALTQSYKYDLPEYYPGDPDINPQENNNALTGPAWAQPNPQNITFDKEFTKLNSAIQQFPVGSPLNPLLTNEHSALTQQVWNWIQASSTAKAWLGGTADANKMVVNPAYNSQILNVGQTSTLDSYPRADDGGATNGTCAHLGFGPTQDPPPANPPPGSPPAGEKVMTRCALDLLPYGENFDSIAAGVLVANNTDGARWDASVRDSSGSFGWWAKGGVEPLGQIFMWGATDTSNLAAYGLIPAQLCDDSGGNCVGPTSASLTAALGAAKPDSSGLLHVDPANPGSGGYPLTEVIYAAVSTNQDPATLNNYADLIAYAAGTGQTVGSAAGDLAPGYLPLPSDLQAKATDVVTQLRALASGSASPTPTPSTTTPGGGDLGGGSTPRATPSGSTTSPATRGGTTGGSTSGSTPALPTTGSPTTRATPAPEPAALNTPVPGSSHPASSSGCTLTALLISTPSPTPSPSRSASPAPSCSPSGGAVISLPPTQALAAPTPKQVVGVIRWVLIAVLIAGGVCAAAGTVLSSGRIPPWLRRRRPAPSGVAPPGAGM